MRKRSDSLAVVMLAVLLSVGGVVETTAKNTEKVPALFLFGDSLADTGTNDYIPGFSYPVLPQANIVPYGETFFRYPTGRWCNGRLMFDFIAEYLNLPFPEPYLKPGAEFSTGACFASAGSGILKSTFADAGVISLPVQLQQFEKLTGELEKELGSAKASCILSKSLYTFVTGTNDIIAYFFNPNKTITSEQLVEKLITDLEIVILKVISLGARKIVLVGQGPTGCLPLVLVAFNSTGACVEGASEISIEFDKALAKLVTKINAKLKTTVVILSHKYDTELHLILNGASKGFTGGLSGCCGTGPFNGVSNSCGRGNYTLCSDVSKFARWDFVHVTERVNRIFALHMWKGNTRYMQPINIHELIST